MPRRRESTTARVPRAPLRVTYTLNALAVDKHFIWYTAKQPPRYRAMPIFDDRLRICLLPSRLRRLLLTIARSQSSTDSQSSHPGDIYFARKIEILWLSNALWSQNRIQGRVAGGTVVALARSGHLHAARRALILCLCLLQDNGRWSFRHDVKASPRPARSCRPTSLCASWVMPWSYFYYVCSDWPLMIVGGPQDLSSPLRFCKRPDSFEFPAELKTS